MIAPLATIGILALYGGPQPAHPLDPFQQCAIKALSGAYGKLAPWQRYGYALGLVTGAQAERLFVLTHYTGDEGRAGRVDRRGKPCTLRTSASNLLPHGSYVWTEKAGLRQVLDCGARRNDSIARRIAKRRGCPDWRRAVWVDVWYPTARAARQAGLDGWHPCRGAIIPGPAGAGPH